MKAKILELGLVADAKELRKKRPKKSRGKEKTKSLEEMEQLGEFAEAHSDSEVDESSEDSDSSCPGSPDRRPKKKHKQYAFQYNKDQAINSEATTPILNQLVDKGLLSK